MQATSSKPQHTGNGDAIDVAVDVEHAPAGGAGFGHPVFQRLHAVAESIRVYPPEPGKPASWAPDSVDPDPCRHWAYYQDCKSCHGGFHTLDAAALFCPWCGTEIENVETDARDIVVSLGRTQVIATERERTQRMLENQELLNN